MADFYIREEDGTIRETSDAREWAKWFQTTTNRVIERTDLPNGRWVSTVFLGIDHGFTPPGEQPGPPLLFETMVFDKDANDLDMRRYATEEEAHWGHAELIMVWRDT